MGVHGETDVASIRAHLDCEGRLRDQVAGVDADDAGAEQALRARVEQQFREALTRQLTTGRRGPGEGTLS